ncbi:MAG: trehalase-like domain-containing protein [Streptosporangiaceae bacterium]
MPAPPDSPSVYGALLDRAAGEFRFGPTSAQVPHHRRYVPGTMVLETTWHTPTGWLVVHDLLVMGRTDGGHRRADYRRALTDFGATGVLLRTATCIGGQVEVLVDCSRCSATGLPAGPGATGARGTCR